MFFLVKSVIFAFQILLQMKINPKTKIIASIGPGTSSEDMLEDLMMRGVNVFRINLSHDTHENHRQVIRRIHALDKKHRAHVAILADLQGPKLRIGEVENDHIILEDNSEVVITTRKCTGSATMLYISYQDFPKDARAGEAVLIDDGKIKLEVIESDGIENVRTRVIHGGEVSSRKGVNLPNTRISLPSLTEKDIEDACFAIEEGVHWIGLSFVRTAQDLKPLRMLIHSSNRPIYIMAKIEKPEAIANIDDIILDADGIMVARGDLGVEIPFDQVPVVQKRIVKKCLINAKPCVIATQMLESMITHFRPTRAEANDVANAVMDGADAVMLSGETAIGRFPKEAVDAMHSIALYTENHDFPYERMWAEPNKNSITYLRDSICYNAVYMAAQTNVKAIIVFTNSGYTARKVASYRPHAKIHVFTNNENLIHKMSILWGAKAFFYSDFSNIDETITESIRRLKAEGEIESGDIVMHVGSTPITKKGSANMVRLSRA